MVKVHWFDSKPKVRHAHDWTGTRIRKGNKRIELRNSSAGASMLIIISGRKVHPKYEARRANDRFPATLSMNSSIIITPEFARDMAKVIERGREELKQMLTLHELEGKGNLRALVRRERRRKRANQ